MSIKYLKMYRWLNSKTYLLRKFVNFIKEPKDIPYSRLCKAVCRDYFSSDV